MLLNLLNFLLLLLFLFCIDSHLLTLVKVPSVSVVCCQHKGEQLVNKIHWKFN